MLLEDEERILQAQLEEEELPPVIPAGYQADNDGLGGVTESVRIIADTENNSLLVWSTSHHERKDKGQP